MADSPPLLSILMPTRNRVECARHAIANILKFEALDFELIVQDNSDDSSLSELIGRRPFDKRLRYIRIGGRLSISQNFELAIEQARGRFLCCLGDDDGLNPCVIEMTRWIEKNGIDALSPTLCAHYYWPGVSRQCEGDGRSGRLVLSPFNSRTNLRDPEEELFKCVRAGAVQQFVLPRIYHGVVRRRCIEQVKQKTGFYTPGVSPDMAASIALASFVNRVLQVDYPVFVPGASATSGAGRGVQKTHHGDLSSEGFLDRAFVDRWPQTVPAYFSGPTMWGAAAIQALQVTGKQEVLEKYNSTSLHAACAAFVPSRFADTIRNFRDISPKGNIRKLVGWVNFTAAYAIHCLRRFRQLLVRSSLITFSDEPARLVNIDSAMSFLAEKLEAKPFPALGDVTPHFTLLEPKYRQDRTSLPASRGRQTTQDRASA